MERAGIVDDPRCGYTLEHNVSSVHTQWQVVEKKFREHKMLKVECTNTSDPYVRILRSSFNASFISDLA